MKKINNIVLSFLRKYNLILLAILGLFIGFGLISIVSYYREREYKLFYTIMTIDDYEISDLEYSYYYQTYMSSFISDYSSYINSLDIKEGSSLEKTIIDETTGQTFGDIFSDQAYQNIMEVYFMYELAIKEGYTVDTLKIEINDRLKELRNSASLKDMSYKEYLSSTFIDGTKEKDLKGIIERQIIAEHYKEAYKESFKPTQEEIDQYYEDNKLYYDVVNYRLFTFSVYNEYLDIINKESYENATNNVGGIVLDNIDITSTKEYQEAEQNILEKVSDFYDHVYNEETFKDLCVEYARTEESAVLYEIYDYSLKENQSFNETKDAIAEWLFDEDRQERATAIIYDENNYSYYIVYFISRTKDIGNYVTVNNIFIPYVSSDPTTFLISDEDKEVVKLKVENIIVEWNEGSKTLEDFNNLIEKYDKNTLYSDTKGVYSNLLESELPSAISSWCYDSNRVSGDIAILDDDAGYYVTYFYETAGDKLNIRICSDLIEYKYLENLRQLANTHDVNFY